MVLCVRDHKTAKSKKHGFPTKISVFAVVPAYIWPRMGFTVRNTPLLAGTFTLTLTTLSIPH